MNDQIAEEKLNSQRGSIQQSSRYEEVDELDDPYCILVFDQQQKAQTKFPILTSKLLQEAIQEHLLRFDEKDKIIRDPNIHTLLIKSFKLDSPRTLQALDEMAVDPDSLRTRYYAECYNTKKKPIENLVSYLKYITEHYKLLSEVLKKRNIIKRQDMKQSKISQSKDIRFASQKISFASYRNESVEQSTLMLTELQIDEAPKFIKLQKKASMASDVSFKKRVSAQLISLPNLNMAVSPEEKKEQFDKKIDKQQVNFQRYFKIALNGLQKKDNYYSSTLPQQMQRVETNKNNHLNEIKAKLKKRFDRDEQLRLRVKEKHEQSIQEHPKKVEIFEKEVQKHIDRKADMFNSYLESVKEQKKHQQQLEQERQLRLNMYRDEENQIMHSVLEKLQEKETHLKHYMTDKYKTQQSRQEQQQKEYDEKILKMQVFHKEEEKSLIKGFCDRATNRQLQLNRHDEINLKKQKEISLKNLKSLEKIQRYQEIQQERELIVMEKKLEDNNGKIEDAQKRYESLIELKKLNAIQSNQIRQQKAKVKYFNQLLHQKYKQDKILQHSLEMSKKLNLVKQEQADLDKYKQEQLLEQGDAKYDLLHSEKF